MFDKILVALDNSSYGEKVLDAAISLAKATGARLMLLHVLSHEEEGSPNFPVTGLEYYPTIASEMAEMYQKQWTDYESRGLEKLKAYAEQASAAGVAVEFTQNLGSPGRTVCEVARTWEADLIVMGRRGHSGLNELLLGSVSSYILHHAHCSVFTVQGSTQAKPNFSQDKQAVTAS